MTPADTDTLVTIPIFDEEHRVDDLLARLRASLPAGIDVLFVDDASTDATSERIAKAGFEALRHPHRRGCGPSVRTGLDAGRDRGYRFLAVMAGNGKDDPAHLSRILAPLRAGGADFVQGSRYLPGGGHANMPAYRKLGTRAYSLLFSLLTGQRIRDATNGFRALRRELLDDRRIDLDQAWLVDYEVESYLFAQALRLGYRVTEVPVTKLYPKAGAYTKMRAFRGWWSHFRPALLLALRLRR